MSEDINKDRPYVVVSGEAAFSWGRYATREEAVERRSYLLTNEPTAAVFKRVEGV